MIQRRNILAVRQETLPRRSCMREREVEARARRARSLLTGGRRVGASQDMSRRHSRGGDGCTARLSPGSRTSACLGRRKRGEGRGERAGARVPDMRENLLAQLPHPSDAPFLAAPGAARAAPRPALYSSPGKSCADPCCRVGCGAHGTAGRAASQQAGHEPGHCRGRGRTLLPSSMRVLGQLGHRVRACRCGASFRLCRGRAARC
jgi:hypothetical protein